jgi:phage repressor protein C with HTH and peptisase S24 domain
MLVVNRQSYLLTSDNFAMSTFGERLRLARKEKGLSQGALAKIVGVKQPTIAELESEGKGSSRAGLIAKALDVSVLWLSEGKGKKELFNDLNVVAINSVEIPLLAAQGSMGDGNDNHDADFVIDVLRVTKNWVSKTLSGVTRITNLRFIHAIGDSMHPTFNDGDILLVDTGVNTVTSDSVYVLDAHNRLFIKRVRGRMDGTFEISSDNPSVKTVDILNGNNEVDVKGRVVWVWNGRKV